MLHLVLWIILAVWVGIAVLILVAIVSTILISTARMLLDRLGVRGSLWCPVLQRSMAVLGVPAAFVGTVTPFDDLRRCERFGDDKVKCHKWCVHAGELAVAAKTN